jgi:hypothetical protein
VPETIKLSRPDIARMAIVEELQFRPDLMQMVADVIQEREELESQFSAAKIAAADIAASNSGP